MWNPFDFSDKKIIITGAASGIGRAVAIALSRQGAKLCLIDRNPDALLETCYQLEGDGHRPYTYDLLDSEKHEPLFDEIVSDGKKIDGLVHCAGIVSIIPAGKLSRKNMNDSMAINFYSFIEMAGILSKKKYHDNASIVGVSSISVLFPQKCQTAYVATKAAMNGAVNSLAIELSEKGIRINTVMPGVTNTRMQEISTGMTADEISQHLRDQILGLIEPCDIANVIMFLLSDASAKITGRSIPVDGGTIPDLSIKE